MNISKLHIWADRQDCKFIREAAIKNLINTAEIFLNEEPMQQTIVAFTQTENQNDSFSNSQKSTDSFGGFYKDDNYQCDSELGQSFKSLQIEREKLEFIKLLDNNNLNFANKSTANFWLKEQNNLPNISKLAIILLNIPSSSAFIERHYSKSGNIVKPRCRNMSSETIIKRSILKSNMKILDELSL